MQFPVAHPADATRDEQTVDLADFPFIDPRHTLTDEPDHNSLEETTDSSSVEESGDSSADDVAEYSDDDDRENQNPEAYLRDTLWHQEDVAEHPGRNTADDLDSEQDEWDDESSSSSSEENVAEHQGRNTTDGPEGHPGQDEWDDESSSSSSDKDVAEYPGRNTTDDPEGHPGQDEWEDENDNSEEEESSENEVSDDRETAFADWSYLQYLEYLIDHKDVRSPPSFSLIPLINAAQP